MKFKLITPDAPEYLAERLLRWEVLAKPHGMPPGSEAFPEEMQSLHLIALEGKRLVGCICFHPETISQGRIFEMAVSEEYQGRGFGRKLLHALEEMLVERGIQDVYLFARPENEEFYSLMGYRLEEEVISQMGLKQRKMKKNLHVESGKMTDAP
ncbi:MAG: GNAT family N-acetyltransferase [Verrucomicrobia bacterium]|nr:GNAT family N-acetyltransferase [Verrucomicrobiota bacterium]